MTRQRCYISYTQPICVVYNQCIGSCEDIVAASDCSFACNTQRYHNASIIHVFGVGMQSNNLIRGAEDESSAHRDANKWSIAEPRHVLNATESPNCFLSTEQNYDVCSSGRLTLRSDNRCRRHIRYRTVNERSNRRHGSGEVSEVRE